MSPVTRLMSKQSVRSARSMESLPASPTRVFGTELLGVLWWTGAYTVHQNVLIGNVVKGRHGELCVVGTAHPRGTEVRERP